MSDIDKILDDKIDEILIDFDTWCLCRADECVLAQNFKQAKQAIKQLIEDEVNMDSWRVMVKGE